MEAGRILQKKQEMEKQENKIFFLFFPIWISGSSSQRLALC
jgi:hypothetical protein